MKKLMLFLCFLGLATTSFANGTGTGMYNFSKPTSNLPDRGMLLTPVDNNEFLSNDNQGLEPIENAKRHYYFLEVNGGAGFSRIGKSQSLPEPYRSSLIDYYENRSKTDIAAILGLNGGLGFVLNKYFRLEFSLGFHTSWNHSSSGSMYNWGLKSYDYKYKVSSYRIMAESSLGLNIWKGLGPYVSAGVGFAHLVAHNFAFYTLQGAEFSKPFADSSSNNFAAQVGAGLAWQATSHFNFKLGDRLVYLGETSFAGGDGRHRLKTGKIYVYEIITGVQYVF